jgi:hypothetical protein
VVATDSPAGESRLYRTLDPDAEPDNSWDELVIENTLFDASPRALRTSEGSTRLWAIDTSDVSLQSFTDTLTDTAPAPIAPEDDSETRINPVTSRAAMVSFLWERPAENVEAYELWIAFDRSFEEVVRKVTIENESEHVSVVVGPDTDEALEWNFDTAYFWKVRVKENNPVKSPWSETRRFIIEEIETEPPVSVETPPTPEITVEVPPPTDINVPPPVEPPPVPAAEIPPYIWGMIVIGALLVVALVILITMTRRIE